MERLAELLPLGDDDRRAWLRSTADAVDANWFLHAFLVIDGQIGGDPSRGGQWVALRLWFLDEADLSGALSPGEVAQRLAYFVHAMRDRADVAEILPSADGVVSRCLAALPVALAEVATVDHPAELSNLGIEDMRLSRRAKNLITAASYHVEHLQDPALAAQLRDWLAVRPRLV